MVGKVRLIYREILTHSVGLVTRARPVSSCCGVVLTTIRSSHGHDPEHIRIRTILKGRDRRKHRRQRRLLVHAPRLRDEGRYRAGGGRAPELEGSSSSRRGGHASNRVTSRLCDCREWSSRWHHKRRHTRLPYAYGPPSSAQ